jgi:HK97 family phage portal protein
MSFLLQLLGITSMDPARNPDDERWWGGTLQASVAGVRVDADTARKISAVYACVSLISETIGSLPLVMYRNLDNDGRARARNHPLYTLLHDQPNSWQTAAEFREMMTGHLLLRGNAYAEIVPGARGAVDQLVPLHPDRVTVERLPNGRLRYQVSREDGKTPRPLTQDDIFHLRGPSRDGIVGDAVIDFARDSFGLTLAAERYGSRFFRNDSRPGGILKTDSKLSPGAAKRIASDWRELHTQGNQHRVAVFEQGLSWQQVGVNPDQAQFLETREFQAEDVARWFRVPPHMIGLTSKATTWGSGIEQMSIAFVTYTLMPWLVRWQQAISRDLILAPDVYFAEFVVSALLRGDTESRYNAYQVAIATGFMTRNEARQLENFNPLPGLDEPLQPQNTAPSGVDGEPAANHHYRALAEEAAGRLVRKERAAVTRIFERDEGSADAIVAFFNGHIELVTQTLRVPVSVARNYCQLRATICSDSGEWNFDEQALIEQLTNLAIEVDYER